MGVRCVRIAFGHYFTFRLRSAFGGGRNASMNRYPGLRALGAIKHRKKAKPT